MRGVRQGRMMENYDSVEGDRLDRASTLDNATRSVIAFQDLIQLCWRLVFRNRRRYKLVIVAVGAGVWGLVLVMNIGDSVETKIGEHLTILGGATIIDVQRSDFDSHHPGEYTMNDVRRLKAIPHVRAVAPMVSLSHVETVYGQSRMRIRLVGVDESFWSTIMAYCLRGRLIDIDDVKGRRASCVLGEDVVEGLFSGVDPVHQQIQLGGIAAQVVGLLGGIQGDDTRQSVFLPISLARHRFRDMYSIREMRIRVSHWNHVEAVREQVEGTLRAFHPGYAEGIRVKHFPERIKRVRNTVEQVTYLAYLGSTVALILGGIGAFFLMHSAVRERTREIGLRKAVGAGDETIMLQFVLETVLVTLIGGIIGLAAAVLTCLALEAMLGLAVDSTLLMITAVASGLGTICLGVIAGLYPARLASRMDPAVALRFE